MLEKISGKPNELFLKTTDCFHQGISCAKFKVKIKSANK